MTKLCKLFWHVHPRASSVSFTDDGNDVVDVLMRLSLPAGIHGASRPEWDGPPHAPAPAAGAGGFVAAPAMMEVAVESLVLRTCVVDWCCNGGPIPSADVAGGSR